MNGLNLMQGWVALLGSLSVIAIIVVAIGLMLGIVKPADAPKHIGTIVVIVVGLLVVPGILGSAWSATAFWQQLALIVIGCVVLLALRPRGQRRREREK